MILIVLNGPEQREKKLIVARPSQCGYFSAPCEEGLVSVSLEHYRADEIMRGQGKTTSISNVCKVRRLMYPRLCLYLSYSMGKFTISFIDKSKFYSGGNKM